MSKVPFRPVALNYQRIFKNKGRKFTPSLTIEAALDTSKQWSNVFSILREKDYDPQLLCQVKLAFKCDGGIKEFSDLQSLSKFISQKSSLKELLKDVLSQNETINPGGRRYGIQEKEDETQIGSKHGAGGAASDSSSFPWSKEVKTTEPEDVKNRENLEESPEWKEKEASLLEDEEASEVEEDEEVSGVEEEEGSGLEEWGEEASELEEWGEEASGLEEEEEERGETSLSCEDRDSPFQGHSVVHAKRGVEEITGDGVDIILVDVEEDSEPEEEEEEGNVSEIGKVGAAIQAEKRGGSGGLQVSSSCLVSESKKEKWRKPQVADKTRKGTASGVTKNFRKTDDKIHKFLPTEELTSPKVDLIRETEENFRRSVINSIREMQEEIRSIKGCHPEVSNIKNSIDDLNSGMDVLEERLNSLEDQIEEFSQDTIQMTKQMISKERLRDIEDRSRSSNIRLIGIPEKNNHENAAEDIIKEIIDENFPELKKESTLEIVSASRIPSKIDKRKPTPRHILVKFCNSSDKEKILRASRERKEITYRETRIRLTADLSLDTLDARSKWSAVIKVLQEKGFKPRILYPAKLAFDFQGKTKTFLDIEEFRKSISYIPCLKELLENIV
ncbi:LINE-1 type transposase domain-containing protein 1 [Otolemur garnettii]|uniref:LINE-1 type transposase domain-containing protein 1 n=1 Tax=Otolemur garnettii TaxID=30611 RepID=UPI000C7EF654|nr:LINE-1 type transposase domain-containing protein 1 [Otolemur garnettii]